MAEIKLDTEDLLIDFKRANDKREQIRVLADLNCCSPRTIAEVLQERGALEGTGIKPSMYSNVYHPPAEVVDGKQVRKTKYNQDFDEAEARRLFDAKLDDASIASRLNVAEYRIRNWRKDNDLRRDFSWHNYSGKKEGEADMEKKETGAPGKAQPMTVNGFKALLKTLLGANVDGAELLIGGAPVYGISGYEVRAEGKKMVVDLHLAEVG